MRQAFASPGTSADNFLQAPSWQLLYASAVHGHSGNRLQHHAFLYKGPTLLLVKTTDEHLFAIAVDQEWRADRIDAWGGPACRLLRLQPSLYSVSGQRKWAVRLIFGAGPCSPHGPRTQPYVSIPTPRHGTRITALALGPIRPPRPTLCPLSTPAPLAVPNTPAMASPSDGGGCMCVRPARLWLDADLTAGRAALHQSQPPGVAVPIQIANVEVW